MKKNIKNIINQIIDSPQLYLIQYYDDLKAKVDIYFETKLQPIRNIKRLKDQTTKEWIKYIEIIEKCFAKCIKNKIPIELINRAKIDEMESDDELEEIKNKLESHLFSNDSSLCILNHKSNQIVIIEDNIGQQEIEW